MIPEFVARIRGCGDWCRAGGSEPRPSTRLCLSRSTQRQSLSAWPARLQLRSRRPRRVLRALRVYGGLHRVGRVRARPRLPCLRARVRHRREAGPEVRLARFFEGWLDLPTCCCSPLPHPTAALLRAPWRADHARGLCGYEPDRAGRSANRSYATVAHARCAVANLRLQSVRRMGRRVIVRTTAGSPKSSRFAATQARAGPGRGARIDRWQSRRNNQKHRTETRSRCLDRQFTGTLRARGSVTERDPRGWLRRGSSCRRCDRPAPLPLHGSTLLAAIADATAKVPSHVHVADARTIAPAAAVRMV